MREATLAAAGVIAVDARPNGGIEVRGWDRNEVRLRVKIVATSAQEQDAREIVGQVQVDTTGTVQVSGPERRRGQSWYASFRLDVPRAQALRLQAETGASTSRTSRATSSSTPSTADCTSTASAAASRARR